jgi:hypothetical protein
MPPGLVLPAAHGDPDGYPRAAMAMRTRQLRAATGATRSALARTGKEDGRGGRAAGTELVRATGRPVRRAIDEVLLGDVRVTSAAEGRRMLAGEEETVEALWRVIAAARPPRKPRLASVCVLCWLIRPRPQQPDAVARRRRQREQPRQSRNGRLRLVRTRNGANRPRTGLGAGRAGASSAVRPQGALRAGG